MQVVSFSYSSSKLNELFKQKLHETETFHVGNTKKKKKKMLEEKLLQATISFSSRSI